MQKVYHSGKAKAIGVSNWTIKGLETLLTYATVVPACNQVEVHPYLPNENLIEYCKSKDIVISAYSPLGGQGSGKDALIGNAKLQKFADEKGYTSAQALIAWGVKRGYVVLPKSFTPSRIEKNFEPVEMTEEEFKAVSESAGGEKKRFCDPGDWKVWKDSE